MDQLEFQENRGEMEGEEEEIAEEEEAKSDDVSRVLYEDYYEKNTASFRCLKEILLSNSSLLRNALFHFPKLSDPGLDDAFNYVAPEFAFDDIGVELYKLRCKEYGIVPFNEIIRGLPTDRLDLKYYGIGLKQLRALAEALKRNRHVLTLILEENQLSSEQCEYLNNGLMFNTVLRDLNLRSCAIDSTKCWQLIDLVESTTAVNMDLSNNGIGNAGFLGGFGDAFCINMSIVDLNLSGNALGEPSCEKLAYIFEMNETIATLDISRNEIYTPTAMKKFFATLADSRYLKCLNIAWNGFGLLKESAMPLGKYLRETETLEELDISNNRLSGESLNIVTRALDRVKSLKRVRLCGNTITPDEALAFARLLLRSKSLECIELGCLVTKEFLPLMARLGRRSKTITIEGVLGDYVIREPNVKLLLFERIRYLTEVRPKRKKQKRDFGQFQFTLRDASISKDDFVVALKKGKMKMLVKDHDLVDHIGNTFADSRAKTLVDCSEIKRKWMECYPQTEQLPTKKKKGKGKKKQAAQEDEEKKKEEESVPLVTTSKEMIDKAQESEVAKEEGADGEEQREQKDEHVSQEAEDGGVEKEGDVEPQDDEQPADDSGEGVAAKPTSHEEISSSQEIDIKEEDVIMVEDKETQSKEDIAEHQQSDAHRESSVISFDKPMAISSREETPIVENVEEEADMGNIVE